MRPRSIFFILWFLFPTLTVAAENGYTQLYEQLTHLKADELQTAKVANITITRDVGVFYLLDGHLALCQPINGRICAAVFSGKGRFIFTPATDIEKEQLARFYDKTELSVGFDQLMFIFADTTLVELKGKLNFAAGNQGPVETGDAIAYLKDDGDYFHSPIIKTFLNNPENGYFYSHINSAEGSLAFEINLYAVEEVSLMRRRKGLLLERVWETVCQFHHQADYSNQIDLINEDNVDLRLDNYKLDVTIDLGLDFTARAQVDVRAVIDHTWLQLHLFSDLEVDSVAWGDGQPATYFKKKDNPVLWVKCDPPMAPDEVRQLTLSYHGKILAQDGDWIAIKDPTGWYPRTAFYREKANFDLTFRTPKRYTFVSVGDPVGQTEEDGKKISRWLTKTPIRNASFNIGNFKDFKIEDMRIPPVTILKNDVRSWGKDMQKQVGADVANSVLFCQHIFGGCPVQRFHATEIPWAHGEAFPGLIHMSWWTFQQTDNRGEDEIFRAHEVAHQWCGIAVDFKTYHDQWLSEGFSQYMGLWYMQNIRSDNDLFFKKLREWRKDIVDNRNFVLGKGQEGGPIWLGYRTNTSDTKGDYDLLIYKKGAWVLHMLRNMLMDFKTTPMNEDRFLTMLQDYYQTYNGKQVSTEDFQEIVSKHAGEDMSWFFKQWVYGTAIPTCKFAYKTQSVENGKFKVTCQIAMEDAPDDFKMSVPVLIDFGQERYTRVRVKVQGPFTQIDLPLLPIAPKDVVFNDLESALCVVKKEDWK